MKVELRVGGEVRSVLKWYMTLVHHMLTLYALELVIRKKPEGKKKKKEIHRLTSQK